jgi:hypothetical protein
MRVQLAVVTIVLAFTGSRLVADDKATYPKQILIIRHAEKTGSKDDTHLSERGKERAAVLDQLFATQRSRPVAFPTPDFIFAANAHKDSNRPVETVTPLSEKLKLTIDTRFNNKLLDREDPMNAGKKDDAAKVADEVFSMPKYAGKTILISWRHSTIPELAKALHVENPPTKWDDKIFDRVWQINYDEHGKATFQNLPQRLLPGDSEK